MDDFFFDGVSDETIKKQRAKARQLKKTGWWQKQIGQGKCYYCHNTTSPKDLTMDHIVPLGRGGVSSKGNIVACCKECNTKKKTMLPVEWDEYMNQFI